MSENWSKSDWRRRYEEAVEFLGDRDLLAIPVSEVLERCKSSVEIIRLGLFYEIHRCRDNRAYFKALEGRNVRNIWYDFLQALLMRVEPGEKRRVGRFKETWDRRRTKTLSHELSLMVRKGLVTYKELKIEEDLARPKRRMPDWKKLSVGRFDEVVVFCEKAGQFGRIKCLADLLGIPVETGKGQQATSSIEPMVDYLLEYPERNYLVLCIVDWDYGGYRIYEDFIKRIPELGLTVEAHRIGINPDQISDKVKAVKVWELPMSYKPMREWAAKFGWKGKYGFEIECLTPKQLRGIIADALYEHCDPQALYDFLMAKALDDVPDRVARELAERKMDELYEEITDLEGSIDDIPKVGELQGAISALRERIEEVEMEIEEIPEVEEIREGIEAVEDERDEEALREGYRKKVEERLEWGGVDTREPFPKDWLRKQIVEGKISLRHEKYTSPAEVEKKLKELIEER